MDYRNLWKLRLKQDGLVKIKLLLLLLPVFLLSCSRKPAAQTQAQPQPGGQPHLPFNVSAVETPQAKEISSIGQQMRDLLTAKDYKGLDALAKKFRDSKECYAGGYWKLYYVYESLELTDDDPDAAWTARLEALADWVGADPESITARVAMADEMVCFAWKGRGLGYANEIPESHWKLFFQRLNETVQILNAAKQLEEKCPVWWSVMLQAEMGLQVERSQHDATFNEAITAWPDYTPFYISQAYYLLPRWYGAPGEWENDLKKSSDRIGGDDGDVLYARVVWSMQEFSTNIFKEYEIPWNRVNAGYQIIEKRFPDSLAIENEAAHFACLAGDGQSARKYFDQTQGQMVSSCWDSEDEFVGFAKWAYGVPQ